MEFLTNNFSNNLLNIEFYFLAQCVKLWFPCFIQFRTKMKNTIISSIICFEHTEFKNHIIFFLTRFLHEVQINKTDFFAYILFLN